MTWTTKLLLRRIGRVLSILTIALTIILINLNLFLAFKPL